MSPQTEFDGEYGTATVHGLSRDQCEDYLVEQIETFVDHPAYETDDIHIMPDTHPGAGCVIGFTMPITDSVTPNAVGVDIGCGMNATNFGELDLSEQQLRELDAEIRDNVPMGFDVHDATTYHIIDDFPWEQTQLMLDWFEMETGIDVTSDFDGYGKAYFDDLCERVGADPMRVINSVGTLGGGNHFIELGRDNVTGDVWSIIHSGSRGIGLKIAQYHQEKATDRRTADWVRSNLPEKHEEYIVPDADADDLVSWMLGGKGRSYIDSDAIREDYSGTEIERVHEEIRQAHPDRRPGSGDLDHFEGEEMTEYIQDMMFAQRYASVSRNQMQEAVGQALNVIVDGDVMPNYHIEAVHNYIDPRDGILRKGACPAREGQEFVVPFNMADGTLLCRGKGTESWNQSAPHGSGRVMSRTQAHNEIALSDFEDQMDDVVSTSVTEDTLDEAPDAYKSASMIQEAIEPTAEIIAKLDPILNLKALD